MTRLELILDPWQLESMDEYSRSLPSGTTIGKFWKRAVYERAPTTSLHPHVQTGWIVGCYAWSELVELGEPCVRILWFDVVLRHGPEPRGYCAPDWSNFARYQERGFG